MNRKPKSAAQKDQAKKQNNNHGEILKAYANINFLKSADARTIRILAEYLEPLQRLRRYGIKDTVVFFGSARLLSREEAEKLLIRVQRQAHEHANDAETWQKKIAEAEKIVYFSRYYEEARELALRLTRWSKGLRDGNHFIVCSGGGPGIMEAANRGASEAGGLSIGFNISLPFEQYANPYISHKLTFEFHYFFMRKLWFVYLAKGIVVFPGGYGTMDELFELLTLVQTGKVRKPICIIVYGKEYWNSIVNFDKMIEAGVIDRHDLELFHFVDSVDEAFQILKRHLEENFIGK
ncbi:TIGR00730 family Rossman fold protein [candidate division KSB1 bacterium]|nr:TIGR00730 family Rossman fold protein [candidate division KSB1 bacterium]